MTEDVKTQETVNQGQAATQDASKGDREINFEKLRKKLDGLEQEKADRDARLEKQQREIDELRSRFAPVQKVEDDEISIDDSDYLDGAKVKKILAKQEIKFAKKAEEIARSTFQKIDSENFAQRLKTSYPDYESVVTSENAGRLQESDPEYVALLAEVKDEFKRRELAYKRIKKLATEDKVPKVKAQDVVEENRKIASHSFTQSGQGPMQNPNGFEFDVRNKEAREKAYARLKAGVKRSF